jgi:hypothetical protein
MGSSWLLGLVLIHNKFAHLFLVPLIYPARAKRPDKSNGAKLVELAIPKKNTATAARAIPTNK